MRAARTSCYRLPLYRTCFPAKDLDEVKNLNKNVSSISLEFLYNEGRAARQGRIYCKPPVVISTRHAAACAIDSWLLSHSDHISAVRLAHYLESLETIRRSSPEFPTISDPFLGEDDATEHIRSWVDLTQIYRFCMQESRSLQDMGQHKEEDVNPAFVIYPPTILLRVDYEFNEGD
jgi:hypothetical protein